MCDPEELLEEGDKHLPPPPLVEVEEDPVTDIEAELLWESQPHPPRGDVPSRRVSLDYVEEEPQDQAAPSYSHTHHHRGRQQLGMNPGGGGHRVRHEGLKVTLFTDCFLLTSLGHMVSVLPCSKDVGSIPSSNLTVWRFPGLPVSLYGSQSSPGYNTALIW